MKNYVVYVYTRYQDCSEETAKVLGSVEEALAWINKYCKGYGGGVSEYKLFELGKEIPLTTETVEVPQKPIVTTKVVLKKGKK